ncbi:MAG: response regulator, partial [Candidatus Methanosuratus sp.]|nr:response regulator [Candidatus Methanosuratincola sp.]
MARILLVDDDPDFLEITRLILIQHGHEVFTASNGTQALAGLQAHTPHLLILDIMMNYTLEGLDVLSQLRMDAAFAQLPVLIVSSLTPSQAADFYAGAMSLQAQAWLVKPINPDVLLHAVDTSLPADREERDSTL